MQIRNLKSHKLSLPKWLLVCLLFVLGVLAFIQAEPYRKSFAYDKQGVNIGTLPAGTYSILLVYDAVDAEEEFLVEGVSSALVGEDGILSPTILSSTLSAQDNHSVLVFTLEEPAYEVTLRGEKGETSATEITGMEITCEDAFRDGKIKGAFFLLVSLLCLLIFLFLPEEITGHFLWLSLMGVAATLPYLSDYMTIGDDTVFHITRINGLAYGMKNGYFPVLLNYLQNMGRGDLSAAMYPSFFLYPFAILRNLGASVYFCYKLLILVINLGTAYIGFFSLKRITGKDRAGYLFAALYLLSVYRLTNVYYRGAIGESLAMVFFPLVLLGAYELFLREKPGWIWLALGMTGVLQSHVLGSMMCAMYLVIGGVLYLILDRSAFQKRLIALGKAVLAAVLWNLGFLVPFLRYSAEDLQAYLMIPYMDELAVEPAQLLRLFPLAISRSEDQRKLMEMMPTSLGVAVGFAALCFLLMVSFRKQEDGEEKLLRLGTILLVLGILSALMATNLLPWDRLQTLPVIDKYVKQLQFPWRLLGPATCMLLAAGCMAVSGLIHREQQLCTGMTVIALTLSIVSAGYYFDDIAYYGKHYDDKLWIDAQVLSDGMYLLAVSDQFEGLWMDYDRDLAGTQSVGAQAEFSRYETAAGRVSAVIDQVIPVSETPEAVPAGTELPVELSSGTPLLVFPFNYFPGYRTEVDGEEVRNFRYDQRVAMVCPEAGSRISLEFTGFWYFTLAYVIQLLAILGSALYGCANLLGFSVVKRKEK